MDHRHAGAQQVLSLRALHRGFAIRGISYRPELGCEPLPTTRPGKLHSAYSGWLPIHVHVFGESLRI